MTFAPPIPWWLAVLAAALLCAVAFRAYQRPLVPLSLRQRFVLTGLRGGSLLLLLALVCRPMRLLPSDVSGDMVTPVLVDVSRSMGIEDAGGASRLVQATAVLNRDLLPVLRRRGAVDLYGFADRLQPLDLTTATATGARTDLSGAISQVRARYLGRRLPGIVVVSDGGETAGAASEGEPSGPPLFLVGVGSPRGPADREVTSLTAGDPRIDDASVDLTATVVARELGPVAFEVRLLEGEQVVETRQLTPRADAVPLEVTFSVFPDPSKASLYTVEIVPDEREKVTENNRRRVLVNPASRRRRLLVLAGGPGYDHTFLMRALGQDRAFEIDTVVRKGQNEANQDTFLVQAGGGRAADLTSGFPGSKEALFAYDAVIFSNMEAHFLTAAQMATTAEFVERRGGGLLVLGGRSFERRGQSGTPLEVILPVESAERRGAVARAGGAEPPAASDAVALTEEGVRHPIMRLAPSIEESRRLWSTLPPLASTAPLGGARPGASILAVTRSPSGALLPVVAVQRFGRGRSMVFAGEASWRWRMLSPAGDRRYDTFWRQAARWLVADSPDAVSITMPDSVDAGTPANLTIDVVNARFEPVPDATVEVMMTTPDGRTAAVETRPAGGGRAVASLVPATAGLHRLQASAARGSASLGRTERWLLVGNSEGEWSDPRLNEGLLRRLARESGGRYVPLESAGELAGELSSAAPVEGQPQRRDLWHRPSIFALVIGLLAGEWLLRRAWGMR